MGDPEEEAIPTECGLCGSKLDPPNPHVRDDCFKSLRSRIEKLERAAPKAKPRKGVIRKKK